MSRPTWAFLILWLARLLHLPVRDPRAGGAEPDAGGGGRPGLRDPLRLLPRGGRRGSGPVAAALTIPPADLTRIAARRGGDFPADDIAAWIDGRLASPAHGTREMPVWGYRFAEGLPPGELSQELVRGRILTVVEYLRSIQGP